jgi:hypothetical protein
MEETQVHLQPDLYVAAYLMARGFALLGLERVGRRFAFQFNPEAHETAQEYRHGASTEARQVRDFAAALTRLKDELYAAKFAENQLYSEKFKDGNGTPEQHYRR